MTLPAKFVAFGRPARARQTVKSHLDQLAEIWGKSVRYSGFVYDLCMCIYIYYIIYYTKNTVNIDDL
jgi:hypothetical protein